ncbi:hypothetical protein GCM10009623_37020 [Nocardioides aestuarii]|uniref:WD40 repeat domain-containing protein n=1 Tax=Nocardioides aestuarii TaxID=252231 RepID=A0ABW4TQH0_9ACTN
MTSDLRERLHDLADHAPTGDLHGDAVWRHGVRRHRLRVAGAVAGTAAVVALVAGLVAVVPSPAPPQPAGQVGSLGIPRDVRPPDPWSEPTRTPGPLSAVSADMHRQPDGLIGHSDRLMLFGVSAVDGRSRFLDLPGRQVNVDSESVALSDDGTLVATVRMQGRRQLGWDVLDVRTGELTSLRLPGNQSVEQGWGYLQFTADGRFLVTNLALDGESGETDDSLVAWELASGAPAEVEGPGHYWIPGTAHGPTGVVWTRRRDVHVADPDTGERTSLRLPHQLVDAAYAPDGRRLAYVGTEQERGTPSPWRLYLTDEAGQESEVALAFEPVQVLGWRDDTHVVVSAYGPRRATVVDVMTGEVERLRLGAESTMVPVYARGLWSRPVAHPADQPGVGDPRVWMDGWFQAAIAGALLLGAVLLVRRRRRG